MNFELWKHLHNTITHKKKIIHAFIHKSKLIYLQASICLKKRIQIHQIHDIRILILAEYLEAYTCINKFLLELMHTCILYLLNLSLYLSLTLSPHIYIHACIYEAKSCISIYLCVHFFLEICMNVQTHTYIF